MPLLAIPATLQDPLMARLERLAPVREVAQLAAVIGREFSYALIAAAAPMSEDRVTAALDQLVTSGLVFQRGTPPEAIYSFKHALVCDAAYQSLLRSKRQHLHTRIVDVLESRFPSVAESSPELLAHHLSEAGQAARAIAYLQRASRRALSRSAESRP